MLLSRLKTLAVALTVAVSGLGVAHAADPVKAGSV